VVSALCAESHDGRKQSSSPLPGREYLQKAGLVRLLDRPIDLRLVNFAADVDDQQSGEDSNLEHDTPCHFMGKARKEDDKKNHA
jgi:hypothetical protein